MPRVSPWVCNLFINMLAHCQILLQKMFFVQIQGYPLRKALTNGLPYLQTHMMCSLFEFQNSCSHFARSQHAKTRGTFMYHLGMHKCNLRRASPSFTPRKFSKGTCPWQISLKNYQICCSDHCQVVTIDLIFLTSGYNIQWWTRRAVYELLV